MLEIIQSGETRSSCCCTAESSADRTPTSGGLSSFARTGRS